MRLTFTLSALVLVLFCSYSYAQAPANYYTSASGKGCSDLKTTLQTIISSGTSRTYDELWSQFAVSDVKAREVGQGSSKVIYDVYSDKPGPSNDPYNFTPGSASGGQQDHGMGGNAEGEYYNREHSIPLSWFNGNAGNTGPSSDYLHIFPTDKYLNNRRANSPYGKVGSGAYTTLNGSKIGTSSVAGITGMVYEPIDSFKGDIARAFLYFVTRYENSMPVFGNNAEAVQAFEPNTYPSVDTPYLRLMISWHHLDPVSVKELNRNNASYTYQGNRNPYIDHPEYVDQVWNNTCPGLITLPADIVLFSGKLVDDQVRLSWQVANEKELDSYEIERSFNGSYYQNAGKVAAAGAQTYFFTDNTNESRGRDVYYRLKKNDKDGRFSYSSVLMIHIPLNTKFMVYPNPATTYIRVQMSRSVNGLVTLQLADIKGRLIQQKTLNANGSYVQLSTGDIAAGTYLLKILYANEQYIQKVIVVKQ